MSNCPYCNAEIEINHDDGYGYDENDIYEQQCGKCEKYFAYRTTISISHETFKADCLNGAKHKYQPTVTFPKQLTKMRCEVCGEKRKPEPAEWEIILKRTTECTEIKKDREDTIERLVILKKRINEHFKGGSK